MDNELRKKLEEIANTVELPSTIKYICACAAGLACRKMEMEKPAFIRSESAMTVNIWLMPELAAGFKHREVLNEKSKEIESMLGDMYRVGVCPTKNDLIFREGFYVTIPDKNDNERK